MATVSVVIAYRDMGDPHRRAAYQWVRQWYTQPGWEVIVEGGTSNKTFTRASAINSAIRQASGDVIIQADPDSIIALTTLYEAVRQAGTFHQLVIPHDRYLYLTQDRTRDILDGRVDILTSSPVDCEFSGPDGVGNVVVFHRQVWEQAGGFDERFGLWGGDDAAYAYSCAGFCGPERRLSGDVYHLWHPRLPQSNPEHPKYIEQFALLAEYRDASEIGPEAVRQLVRSRQTA